MTSMEKFWLIQEIAFFNMHSHSAIHKKLFLGATRILNVCYGHITSIQDHLFPCAGDSCLIYKYIGIDTIEKHLIKDFC